MTRNTISTLYTPQEMILLGKLLDNSPFLNFPYTPVAVQEDMPPIECNRLRHKLQFFTSISSYFSLQPGVVRVSIESIILNPNLPTYGFTVRDPRPLRIVTNGETLRIPHPTYAPDFPYRRA